MKYLHVILILSLFILPAVAVESPVEAPVERIEIDGAATVACAIALLRRGVRRE
jgi:hypothetical protein